MADNTTINSGTGGDVIRDIDRGSAKTQVLQVDVGGDASNTEVLASKFAPIPVAEASDTEGLTLGDLLTKVLLEVRITNELLFAMGKGKQLNQPNEYRREPSIFDENSR